MVELTVKVEETLVKSLGQQVLERQVEDFLQRLMLKIAAEDILSDFKKYDLTNDPQWQVARSLAWDAEKEKYLPKRNQH
jgi:hypothetical protein